MSDNQLAIIVLSCDKYSDAWIPFFNMFFKYWGDCRFPIYLCSETQEFNHPKVKNLKSGKALEWSARLQWALEQITEPYVLFLLEDYILLKPVQNERIEHNLNILIKTKAGYLRLIPCPPPDTPLPNYPGIGIIKPGSPYRNSTQASIWNKETLLSIINPTETVWDFELIGTHRTDNLSEKFLCVEKNGFPFYEGDYPYSYFCTAIVRGEWVRKAVKLIRRNGFDVDLTKRPQESLKRTWKRFLRYNYNKYYKGISPYSGAQNL